MERRPGRESNQWAYW